MLPLLAIAAAQADCNTQEMSARMQELMGSGRVAGAQVGAIVVEAESGRTLWATSPDLPLPPASTQKLLTTLAVLDSLGPSEKLVTQVETPAPLVDGVLQGDLYISGAGDPALEFPRWWKLALDTYVRGVHRVEGDLIIDSTRLPSAPIPGWDGGDEDYLGAVYEAPISAVNVNYNVFGILVDPGATRGAPPVVRLEVPTRYVTIDNQATTGRRGKLQVDRFSAPDGVRVQLTGSVREGASTRWIHRSITDPPAYAGATFREFFEQAGGSIAGVTRSAAMPIEGDHLLIASTWSPPTAALLSEMMKHSNNQMAEQLAQLAAPSPTPAAVIKLLQDTLVHYGIAADGAVIQNASGLSRQARMTPRQIAAVVGALHAHPKWQNEALAGLSIYSRDGTLRRRLRNSTVSDRVRAKTGTLTGVATIAGIAQGLDGTDLLFALLIADLADEKRAFPVWDTFVAVAVESCLPG